MVAKATRPPQSVLRVELIDVFGVMALTGWSYQTIKLLTRRGNRFHPGFRWVWNFAANPGGQRHLRFWRTEIDNGESVAQLNPDVVLEHILPLSQTSYSASEVETLFVLNHTMIMRLRGHLNGKLRPGGNVFPRAGLERFLRARWLGTTASLPAARRQSRCLATAV